MSFTEFYITPTGDNRNSGSTTDDAAPYTSTNGDWGNSAANRFLAAGGATPFTSVTVGMWASIFLDAATSAVYIAQVTAVDAGGTYVDLSTTAVIGGAPATGATGRSCFIGGAWGKTSAASASLDIIFSLFNAGTVSAPTRVNIKCGVYANGSTSRTISTAGTATAPLWWRGYKGSAGDQDNNPLAAAGTDIPSITFTTGRLAVGSAYNILSSLDISGAAVTTSSGQLYINSGLCTLFHVRSTNTAANSNGIAIWITSSGSGCSAACCSFTATTSASTVIYTQAANAFIDGCLVTGGIIGLNQTAALVVTNCIFSGQAGDSIKFAGTAMNIIGNSFYAPGGNGINITSSPTAGLQILNNYFENVNQTSKAAINCTYTNTTTPRCIGNAYFNCTNMSGITENIKFSDQGTLGSAGFVSGATGNFAPSSALQGIGVPGVFETVSAYQGYITPGAVQPNPSGGGGTGTGRQPKLRCLGA
jgi:hypothetical protein